MNQQTFSFSHLDTDSSDKTMPKGSYRSMVNCRPNNTNKKAGGVVSSIQSNIKHSDLTFDGQSVTHKGGCVYGKATSLISFYEGQTTNFITIYNTLTNVEAYVIRSSKSINSLSGRIAHCGMIDDILFWIDSNRKMRRLNVAKALTETNGQVKDLYSADSLLIDKFPPLYAPIVLAGNDTAVKANNIRKDIFQFAYAYEYADHEVSGWSPFSKSVLPESTSDLDIEFLNNYIDVTTKTGTSEVKKIYIAYRKGTSGNFVIAERLDKAKLSIDDDTTNTYRFWNNRYAESLADSQDTVLTNTTNPFFEAGSLAISRDNFVMYGLVSDGLTKPTDVVLTLTANLTASSDARIAGYKFGAIHEFGLVFRDENGRTDGVDAITTIEIPFFTDPSIQSSIAAMISGGTIPKMNIDWEVTGSAPSWAKTMSIVCLGNKSIANFVDYTVTKIKDVGVYTYIDISGLNSLKNTESVLNPRTPNSNLSPYTFTEGDRIRFREDKDGALLDATSDKYDYEILGYVAEIVDSAGTVLYPDTIYTNAFGWSAANIGERSVFEIYSPKKEFVDNLYYEVGEIFQVVNGTPPTTTGTLVDGDVYLFNRNMPSYEIGELIADERKGIEPPYGYKGRVGLTPAMNVIKFATGIQVANFTEHAISGCFYHNTEGDTKQLTVTVNYEFTSESDDGYVFMFDRRTPTATLQEYPIFSVPDSDGGISTYHKGEFTTSFNVLNGQYATLYFQNAHNNNSNLIFRTAPKITLSVKIEDYPTTNGISFVESKDYSDFFTSDEHSFGRPYVEIEEDLTVKNNIVYTGKYFADTDINSTNVISPLNVKYVPYEFGLITAMRVRGDTLKVWTSSKEMSFFLGKEQYSDGSGTKQMTLTSNPIGTINVYDTDYGTINPESLLQTNNNIYFYDRKNATIVRSATNGQTDLGELKLKTYFREVTDRINAATSYNVFLGYNDKNKEVIISFVIDGVPETIVLNERDGVFTHSLQYVNSSLNPPTGYLHYGENLLCYLVGGAGWLNEQGTAADGNFFGDQKTKTISFVVNEVPTATKILQNISMQSNKPWGVTIFTESRDLYPYGMYTQINKAKLYNFEGVWRSEIPFNINDRNNNKSLLKLHTGDSMRGRTAEVTLTEDSEVPVQLDIVNVGFLPSAIG